MREFAVVAVAKKEYLENVRNKWIVIVGVLLVGLILLASYTAALQVGTTPSLAPLTNTLGNMMGPLTFLVPILAIMLAHSTISGEQENGSLALLFAQPVDRGEVLVGKFVGLYGVLASAIVAGIGVGGLIVGGVTRNFAIASFVVFLAITLLWAGAWIALILSLSAAFSRRTPSLGWSIFSWFLFSQLVWTLVLLLLAWIVLRNIGIPSATSFLPPWFIAFFAVNPDESYRLTIELAGVTGASPLGIQSVLSGGIAGLLLRATGVAEAPWVPPVFVGALAVWIVVPLVLAARAIARKDL